MNRRRFLELAILSSPFLAGCSEQSETPTEEITETTQIPTETPTSTPTASPTQTPTDTPTDTAADAAFDLSDLSYPDTIRKGEPAEISVQIKNIGGREGSTPVVLRMGNLTLSKEVELRPESSKTVVFTIDDSTGYPDPGSYQLNIEAIASSEVLSGYDIVVEKTFPDSYFVGPDGSDDNSGKREAPLASIQEGLNRAEPGETIRVLPGEYREFIITKRSGKPGNPISITGPEEVVIRPPVDLSESRILAIVHSHIHLIGMTFNGLAKPDKPTDPDSYAKNIVDSFPPSWQDEYPDYLTDIKMKPDAIGNARKHILGTVRTNNLEIGEFRIIGPAGAENLYGESKSHPSGGIVPKNHIGEVVQVGVKHNVFDEGEGDWYAWDTPDESHDIHIHHIDNSAGYSHTELVELGTSVYDAVIEYCTDGGESGKYFLSQDHANWTETSMALRGGRCTLRWCAIEDGYGSGVQIGTPPGIDRNLDKYSHIPDDRFPGKNNSVYGNRIVDNQGLAIAFPYVLYDGDKKEAGPDVQNVICGNEYNADTQADPDKPCGDDVPQTSTIGHLGGDSPWA